MGNAVGDLFYPDNPKRRRQVLGLVQQIADYMKRYFRVTNNLTNFLKENNVEGAANLDPIFVDENETLGHSSKILQNRILTVQKIIEVVDKKLADGLDPALYGKLKDADVSFQERLEIAKKVKTIGTGTAMVICVAVANLGFLVPVAEFLGILFTNFIVLFSGLNHVSWFNLVVCEDLMELFSRWNHPLISFWKSLVHWSNTSYTNQCFYIEITI